MPKSVKCEKKRLFKEIKRIYAGIKKPIRFTCEDRFALKEKK